MFEILEVSGVDHTVIATDELDNSLVDNGLSGLL